MSDIKLLAVNALQTEEAEHLIEQLVDSYVCKHVQIAANDLNITELDFENTDVVLILASLSSLTIWNEYLEKISQLLTNTQVIVLLSEYSSMAVRTVLEAGFFACLGITVEVKLIEGYIDLAALKTRREKFLTKFTSDLNSLSDINQIAGMILDRLQDNDFIGYSKATLALVGTDHDQLQSNPAINRVILDYRGYTQSQINHNLLRPIGDDPLILRVISLGKTYVAPSIDKETTDWEITPETEDVKSWLCMPLYYGRKLVGLITLDHKEPKHYLQVDITIADRFASISAIAIEKSFRNRNLQVIQNVMSRISTIHEIEYLLRVIVSTIMIELRCEQCTFFRRNELGAKTWLEPWVSDPWPVLKLKLHEGEGLAGRVLSEGISRVVVNSSLDPDYVATGSEKSEDYSMIVVPVKVEDRTIGVISADRKEINAFSAYDLELVDLLARQAATIIERTWVLQLLNDIGISVNSSNSPTQVVEKILSYAIEITNANSGVVFRISRTSDGNLELLNLHMHPRGFSHPVPRLEDEESTTREIINKKTILQYSTEFGNEDRINPELWSDYGIRAVIGAPLIFEGEVLGVVFLNAKNKTSFNPIESLALKLFANQAAIAINNSEKLSEAENQREAERRLVEAGRSVNASNDLKTTFLEISRQACELVKAQYSHLALVKAEEDKRVIEFVAAYPPDHLGSLETRVGPIDLEDGALYHPGYIGITGLAVKKSQHVLVRDVESARSVSNSEIARSYIPYIPETMSELAIPIQDKNNFVIGVINIEHSQKYAITERHVDIVRLFATQAATAIQKTRLLEDIQFRASQLQNLYEASNLIMSSSPERFEQILSEVIRLTCETFGATTVVVVPIADGGQINYEEIVTNESRFKSPLFIRDDGISMDVYSRKRSNFITYDTEKENHINENLVEAGVRSAICLPLTSNRGNIGVVWLHFDSKPPRRYESHEIRTFQLYANQIALAYENIIDIRQTNETLQNLENRLKEDSRVMTEGIEGDYKTARRQSWMYFAASYSIGLLGILIIFFSLATVYVTEETAAAIGAVAGIILQAVGALVFARANAANDRMDKYHNELLQIRLLNILLTSSETLEDHSAERESKREVLSNVTKTWFNPPRLGS